MRIRCGFCEKCINVDDYDFARFSKGELIFCDECYEEFRNNKSKVRKI